MAKYDQPDFCGRETRLTSIYLGTLEKRRAKFRPGLKTHHIIYRQTPSQLLNQL